MSFSNIISVSHSLSFPLFVFFLNIFNNKENKFQFTKLLDLVLFIPFTDQNYHLVFFLHSVQNKFDYADCLL